MFTRLARRPLVPIALSCLVGAAAGSALTVPALYFGVGAALAGGVVWWKRGTAVFAALALLFAMEAAYLMQRPMPAERESASLTGTVCLTPVWDGLRTVLTLSGATLDGEPIAWKTRVYAYENIPAALGDRVSMTVSTWRPEGRKNPYGFDFDAWCRRNGVTCATMRPGTAEVTEGGLSGMTLLRAARERVATAIDSAFPAGEAPLVRALVLGDRSDLPEELTDDFRGAGIAHILSVSGLHVTCLAMALDYLLKKRLSRRAAFLVVAPLMAAYAILAGLSGPIVRAVVMYLALRFAPLAGRPKDSLSGLAAAMLVMLAANPLDVGDAGFILSFAAMTGLILLSRPLERFLRIASAPKALQFFIRPFTASVAATAALLPALVSLFGTLQPYGPLVNVLAVPAATIALPLTFLALPLAMIWPAAGAVAAWPAAMLLRGMTWIAGFASGLPRASIPVGQMFWGLGILWALAVYWVSDHAGLSAGRRRAALLLFPAALTLSVLLNAWATPGGLALDFLAVGDADAAVVYADGETYLVDAGNADGAAADYLAKTGRALRAVFLTHPHDDHIGGAGAVRALYPDATVYVPECWDRLDGVLEAQARGGLEGPFVPLSAGDEVPLGESATARVLYPPKGITPEDANDASLVLLITSGDASALLTGDLSDASLLPDIPDVDIFKAPHHGAFIKGAELLLRASSPGVVAVSAGGAAGHPSEAALERIRALGGAAYRTDQCGMVRVRVQQGGWVQVSPFIPFEEEP